MIFNAPTDVPANECEEAIPMEGTVKFSMKTFSTQATPSHILHEVRDATPARGEVDLKWRGSQNKRRERI